MDASEFKDLVSLINDTSLVEKTPEKRMSVYSRFNDIYKYLLVKKWGREYVEERRTFDENAYFQNIAEGYFRLGFTEKVFFELAERIYELWFLTAIQIQQEINQRIHKGTQVHQIGIINEIFGRMPKAWTYYLAGFTEDILEGRNKEDSQAFRRLISLGLSQRILDGMVGKIRSLRGVLTFNPIEIVESFVQDSSVPSYEENINTESNVKLNRAKTLWEELLKERSSSEQ